MDGECVRFTGRVLANLDPAWANAKREIAANQWNNVIDPSEVKKYCGHNIAVATCRKNVLKQHGDGEFWADSDFQLWQDLCPTEQIFFTILVEDRAQANWNSAYNKREWWHFQYMIDLQPTFLDEMELIGVSEADLRAAGWSTDADLDHTPG